MAAPHDLQHPVIHGLGIDADPGGAPLPDGKELFRIQRIRASRFHGKLQTFRQVKGLMQGVQQPAKLLR